MNIGKYGGCLSQNLVELLDIKGFVDDHTVLDLSSCPVSGLLLVLVFLVATEYNS